MDSIALSVEALRLIQEWSRWLVGIDVALVGAVSSFAFNRQTGVDAANFVLEGNHRRTSIDTRRVLISGAILLLVSATWASMVLVGSADILHQIAESPGKRVFEYTIPFPFPGPLSIPVPLWVPLSMQNVTFALGLTVYLLYFGAIMREAPKNTSPR